MLFIVHFLQPVLLLVRISCAIREREREREIERDAEKPHLKFLVLEICLPKTINNNKTKKKSLFFSLICFLRLVFCLACFFPPHFAFLATKGPLRNCFGFTLSLTFKRNNFLLMVIKLKHATNKQFDCHQNSLLFFSVAIKKSLSNMFINMLKKQAFIKKTYGLVLL